MKHATPAAFAVDLDEYDLADRASVDRLRQTAAAALEALEAVLAESERNFSQQIAVAQSFVDAAAAQHQTMVASFEQHRGELHRARAASDAVVQFSRQLAASLDADPLDVDPTDRPRTHTDRDSISLLSSQ